MSMLQVLVLAHAVVVLRGLSGIEDKPWVLLPSHGHPWGNVLGANWSILKLNFELALARSHLKSPVRVNLPNVVEMDDHSFLEIFERGLLQEIRDDLLLRGGFRRPEISPTFNNPGLQRMRTFKVLGFGDGLLDLISGTDIVFNLPRLDHILPIGSLVFEHVLLARRHVQPLQVFILPLALDLYLPNLRFSIPVLQLMRWSMSSIDPLADSIVLHS